MGTLLNALYGVPLPKKIRNDLVAIFFTGMEGSRIPIAVAHGEGFADFSQRGDAQAVQRAMRFVDHHGKPTEAYPANPNGSPDGLTAVTTADGRFTVLMPHPERVFRHAQMSWTAGPLAAPISAAINGNDIVAASVLSGCGWTIERPPAWAPAA